MLSANMLLMALFATLATAAPTNTTHFATYDEYAKAFRDPSIQSSVGRKGICVSGYLDVTVSAQNAEVKLEVPKSQIEVTNLILEMSQVNWTLEQRVLGDSKNVSGTFGIYSQICFPVIASAEKSNTVQFLVHGGGFDRQYWNNAPNYSYVDFAAEHGYTTFLYDRLGTGLSDHPDPIQIVQTPLHFAIAHELVQLLRRGGLGGYAFDHVIGIGHSYGSLQVLSVAGQHPKDFDVLVIAGASPKPTGMTLNTVGQVQTIAALNEPLRFGTLSTGYILPGSIEGLQYGFFRAPNFDPAMLDLAETMKQPQALGEMLVFGGINPAKDFTGAVFAVNGENDLPACTANCLLPKNQAEAVRDVLFPAASNGSGFYLVPGTGHGINYHYGATDAYERIHEFLQKNGF